MIKTKIAIYGAGGFCREVAWMAEEYAKPKHGYIIAAFIDDNMDNHSKTINEIPIIPLVQLRERFPGAKITVALGNPKTRENIVSKCRSHGFQFACLVHENVEMSKWVEVGDGAVICGANTITTNIRLGEHTQINLGCTIGHDVLIGDYVTLSPGVHVSGWVHIGKRVFVGTGAVFVNGTEDKPLVIGDDAIIGAAACVTKDVEPGSVVVGVPAKPLIRY